MNIWIERAPGPINPADPPSRDCPRCEHPSRVPHKEMLVHGFFARISETKGILLGSRFMVGAGPDGFQDAWPCPDAKPGLVE